MMSAALQNAAGRPFDHNEFAQYVYQQFAAQAGIAIIESAGMYLTLRLAGKPVRIDLEPLYQAYLHNPADVDKAIRTLIQAIDQDKPDHQVTDFDRLRPFIYPMLKPLSFLVPVREQQLPMLAYRFFLADLIITYVIHEQNSVAYINEQHMERWRVELDTLHAVALANLRQRTAQITSTTLGEGEQRLFLFNSQDGYDATRLLLPDVLKEWQHALPGQMVIGIPNRDFLLAFGDKNRAILTGIAQRIQLDSVQHAAGLTDQLFMLSDNGIQEYSWK